MKVVIQNMVLWFKFLPKNKHLQGVNCHFLFSVNFWQYVEREKQEKIREKRLKKENQQ
jgi:hypothetical protein